MSDLAEALEKMYRYREAQDLAVRLLDARGSLADQQRLANIYRQRTIPGPAVRLLDSAYLAAVEAHGKDSRTALQMMIDLAESYSLLSDNKRAFRMATEGAGIRSRRPQNFWRTPARSLARIPPKFCTPAISRPGMQSGVLRTSGPRQNIRSMRRLDLE